MLLQKAFRGKNILILGYGKSGQASTKLLQNIAKNIFIYDKNFLVKKLINNKNKIILCKNNLFFEKNNIFFENKLKKIINNNKINFCIVSPGFSIYSKEIKLIKKNKIKLLSELELGAIFCKSKKIFAITGTNGKTTTVNALHHIFKTANKQSFLCGNVGTPLTEIAQQTTKNSFVVCEVSSFQMEVCSKYFKPYASAILNLQPDHLDRHKTLKNYYFCKEKIFLNNPKKICFANYDDKNVIKLLQNSKKINYFSIKNKLFYKNKLNLIKNNNLLGEYNLSNLMCACELALYAGIAPKIIKKAIATFYGLPHRLQIVGTYKNITFINDSKSTNIASTLSALEVVKEKTVLLLGGCDKNLDFSPLVKQNAFCVIAYGETGQKIAKVFQKKSACELATNLQNAFEKAIQIAQKQQEKITILLSPACASFDEFTSYEERGKCFEKLVQEFCDKNA